MSQISGKISWASSIQIVRPRAATIDVNQRTDYYTVLYCSYDKLVCLLTRRNTRVERHRLHNTVDMTHTHKLYLLVCAHPIFTQIHRHPYVRIHNGDCVTVCVCMHCTAHHSEINNTHHRHSSSVHVSAISLPNTSANRRSSLFEQ